MTKYQVKQGALFANAGIVYRAGDTFECENDKLAEGDFARVLEFPPEPEPIKKTLVEGERAQKGRGGRKAKGDATADAPAEAPAEAPATNP